MWCALAALVVGPAGMAQDVAVSLEHQNAERLAKDHVYAYGKAGGMASDIRTREAIKKDGFEVKATYEDTDFAVRKGEAVEEQAGFAAMVVEPPGNTAYIVFRGTDDYAADMSDYLGRQAQGKSSGDGGYDVTVGRTQYDRYKAQLNRLVEHYRGTGRRIVVTGHSLGGALAQRFVADHPEFVDEMVLFQSPGVERDVWKKMLDHKNRGGKVPTSTLYVAEWDKVADFGYGHLGNPEVVVGSFKDTGRRQGVGLSHSVFFGQKPGKRSPYGDQVEYASIGKLTGLKRVSYVEYSKQRKLGGDLSGLGKLPAKAPAVATKVTPQTVDKGVSRVRTAGVAGTWQSDFGPVTLSHPAVTGTSRVTITGSFQQPNAGTGVIQSGSFDPASGTLVIEYYQQWNKATGKATFTLSEDGRRLSGSFQQSNGAGGWSMSR